MQKVLSLFSIIVKRNQILTFRNVLKNRSEEQEINEMQMPIQIAKNTDGYNISVSFNTFKIHLCF